MKQKSGLILVADDDPAIVKLLRHYLSRAGFEVVSADDGLKVPVMVEARAPDLFLLDVEMPGEDGLAVCRRLKTDSRFSRAPVIFITGKDSTADVVAGFEAGGSDYIRKPFHRAEVLARVKTHVALYHSILELERLRQLALDASPSTGLPGNNSINGAITRALASPARQCVLYTDLDNFKAFNDKYGFARGDEAIKFTAEVVRASAGSVCGSGFFLGHVGGDDFVVLAPSARAEEVADEIIVRFDDGIRELYDSEDRERGFISALDRRGARQDFPLMTISLAGVHLSGHGFEHYLEVSAACAELKKAAKSIAGSAAKFERRKRTRG